MSVSVGCDPGMILDKHPYLILLKEVRRIERQLARGKAAQGPDFELWFNFASFPAVEVGSRKDDEGVSISVAARSELLNSMTTAQIRLWAHSFVKFGLALATASAEIEDFPRMEISDGWSFTQVESLVRWGAGNLRNVSRRTVGAFSSTARPITDLIEEQLRRDRRRSQLAPYLWLIPSDAMRPGYAKLNADATTAYVGVGDGFSSRPAIDRGKIVLDGIHSALVRRGEAENSDWSSIAESVVAYVTANSLRYSWSQPWVRNVSFPELLGRAEYVEDLEGSYLRLVVVSGAEHNRVATSDWVRGGPSAYVARVHSAVSMVWDGDDRGISMPRPDITKPGTLRIRLED